MLSPPDSPLGKLLGRYVCARITRMDDVDIALFERDWNNTLYYFLMNADEQIYMRYGGRDPRDPMMYLDLKSLELALAKGLELHHRHQRGDLPARPRPAPLYPRQIPPLVERTFARNQCVECHLIGDFLLIHREQTGNLDKARDMYRWPDIKTIGIELDIPKGLVVKEARGPVQAAGMKSGDLVAALDGTPVWTFGDLQYRYDQVPRDARKLRLAVDRDGRRIDLAIDLPALWWITDLRSRQLSADPRCEFESRPLSAAEKSKYGLAPDGLAGQVIRLGGFAESLKVHDLKVGDIVFAVDGVDRDPLADTPELFIKLRKTAGDTVAVDLIRDGRRMKMNVKTLRMYFRK